MTFPSIRQSPWTHAFLVSVGYLAGALLGVWLTRVGGNVAALWPPNAMLLGALLRRPEPRWHLPVAACGLANLGLNLALGDGAVVSFGFAVANMLEVLIAFAFMRVLVGSTVRLQSLTELLAFLLGPVMVAPVAGATVGAALVANAFAAPFEDVLRTWWMGDAVGMALIAPMVLSWPGTHPAFGPGSTRTGRRLAIAEFVGVSVLLANLILLVIAKGNYGTPSLFLPILLWSALRFGVAITAAYSLTITIVASTANIVGVWPLPFDAGPSVADRVWPLQLFLLLASIPPLLVAVVSRERTVAQAALALSERRLAWAIEAAGGGVWEVELPSGRMLNRDVRALMLGYAEGDLDTRTGASDQLIHPEDIERFRAARQDLLEGRTAGYAVEFQARHRDGRWLWFHSRGRVTERDPEGRPLRASGIATDITERKRLEAEAQESGALYRALVTTSPDGIFVQQRGAIIFANESAAKLLGAPDSEHLRGLPLCGFYEEGNVPHALERARQALSGAVLPPWQIRLRCLDGNMAEVETIAAGLVLQGEPAHLVIARDTAERQRLLREMERLAHHDSLTGLPNRAAFMAELTRARARTLRDGGRLAVMMIDLDHFKPVNDRFGHAAGDMLLVEMAGRLKDSLREYDFVARLGGDEFAALAGAKSEDDVHFGQLAQRIVTNLERTWQYEGHHIRPGGTVGLTLFPEDASAADGLLRHADRALYRAKERERGSWVIYDDTMEDPAVAPSSSARREIGDERPTGRPTAGSAAAS